MINIADTLEAINDRIAQMLEEIDWTPVPKQHRSPHLLGASSKRRVSEDFLGKLAEQNIFVSYRGDSLRIAPHLHINEQDLERLLGVLRDS